MRARAGGRRHVRRRARGRRSSRWPRSSAWRRSTSMPSLTWRRGGAIVPHRAHGIVHRLPRRCRIRPGICSTCSRRTRLPLVDQPYVLVETSRGCPYSCDFCVAPIHQGHKFRERSAKALVDEIERGYREFGLDVLLPVGRHGHAEREDVQRVLRRADRAQAADPVVRQRPRRQPARIPRSCTGCSRPAAGCSRSASRPSPRRSRKDMMKRLEGQKIRAALEQHARGRHPVVRLLHPRLSGRDARVARSARSTTRSTSIRTSRTSIRPCPIPARSSTTRRNATGCWPSEDWSRMEYSYYLLTGQRPRRAAS